MHQCPAVTDAARALPGAEIDWVVEAPFAGVAAMHAAVRRVIPVAVRRWRSRFWSPAAWSEIAAFRRELAAEPYDAVIDTQGLLKSALIARGARGPRHGYDGASAREPVAALFYDTRHRVARGLHAVERNRRLTAAALGYAPDGPCDYGLRSEGGAPAAPDAPYVVLLTMTSRADKLWPEADWRSLGEALAGRGLRALLPWGSEAERERAERIARALPGARVSPRLTILELAGAFRGARAVIGLDTGLTHLALAVGAPTVALYCGSNPGLTGLYGGARAANLGAPGRPPVPREVLDALEAAQ